MIPKTRVAVTGSSGFFVRNRAGEGATFYKPEARSQKPKQRATEVAGFVE
jgi:hypothetical protein